MLLGGLAVGLVAAAPRNRWNQLLAAFLGTVAASFGAEAVAGTIPEVEATMGRVALMMLLLNPTILVLFASAFPIRRGMGLRPLQLGLFLGVAFVAQAWILWGQDVTPSSSGLGLFARLGGQIYIGVLYTYALWLLWTAFARERSDVMAAQLRLIAVAISVPVLARLAMIPEEIDPTHGTSATAIRIALLAPLYLIGRWLLSGNRSTRRGIELGKAWNTVGGLLTLVGAAWLIFNVLLASEAMASGLVEWTWSISWFLFGLVFATGSVRLGAFDADPRALDLSLTFITSIAGALIVLFAFEFGGPAVAVFVVAALVFGAMEIRKRVRPLFGVRIPSPPATAAKDEPGVSGPGAARLTELGGFQPSVPASSDVVAGRYRIQSRVASGATGTVLLAKDEKDGTMVVLKRLHARLETRSETLDLIRRELRVAKRVSHPNLVALHGILEEGGDVYLVEEFVEGGDLASLLAKGRLPESDAWSIARDILLGLEALHDAGIVHGDLKPENVLLDSSRMAKLADFGIARFIHGETGHVEGAPAGTLAYMAPEVAAGDSASPSSDVYAAMAILYESFTGRHYLGGAIESVPRLQEALRTANGAPRSASLSSSLHRYLSRGLARTPAERFDGAGEALMALEGIAE